MTQARSFLRPAVRGEASTRGGPALPMLAGSRGSQGAKQRCQTLCSLLSLLWHEIWLNPAEHLTKVAFHHPVFVSQ